MKENYLINIEGTMEQDGELDSVQLMTRGSFLRKNNNFFISYKETEATGYEGNITTVKAEGAGKVSMLRFGSAPSQLVIEKGRRHVCHYDSGYGVLSLGVAADEIFNHLTDTGGKLTFSYTLDTGDAQLSHNKVKITVQEAE
ncbi:DUF1934 domain-containing protein [Ruminococcaceae bacterium OttesenSCG-928-O06]|nr:DUF1934 domain-containing protein [Ruminococcaceae bacterium OttesenSCG-928-O06]